MRYQLVLFLIGLLSISKVACKSDDVSFLRQINKNEFGKSIIESIQVQLKSGYDSYQITKIVDHLEQLKLSIGQEQQKDSKQNKQQSEDYKNQLDTYEKKIAESQEAITSSKNSAKVNSLALQGAEILVKQTQVQLHQEEENLKQSQEDEKIVVAKFNKLMAQLASQISALAEAYDQVQTLKITQGKQPNVLSLAEISKPLSNIKYQHPKFQNFLNVFSQLMYDNQYYEKDQVFINKILNLIQLIQNELQSEVAFLIRVHQIKINEFKNVQNRITISIDIYTVLVQGTQQKIAKYTQENVQFEQTITLEQQRISEYEQVVKDIQIAKLDASTAYRQRKTRRNEELVIIERVILIFKTNFDDDVKQTLIQLK